MLVFIYANNSNIAYFTFLNAYFVYIILILKLNIINYIN